MLYNRGCRISVAIVRSTLKDVEKNVDQALNLVGYIPRRRKIFLKPNVVNIRKPQTGVITHPRVVEALLRYFSDYEVVIGEGSVVGRDTKEVFAKTGYTSLANKYGVELLDLNVAKRIEVGWKYGVISIPEVLRTHEYINVPTMKTHIVTNVSLAMKNQKGLLTPADKMLFHRLGLHEPIREFARIVKPALTLVDGIICVEGDGPGLSGRRKKMDLLIAGRNMIEVENVCCNIMNINVDEIEHIPAVKVGEIKGLTIDEARRPFVQARSYHRKFNVYYHPYDACSGCINSVGEAVRSIRSPVKMTKFLYWGLIRRLDFVAGLKPSIPTGAQRIICVGNCAARFAQHCELPLVKGCPPKPDDIKKVI